MEQTRQLKLTEMEYAYLKTIAFTSNDFLLPSTTTNCLNNLSKTSSTKTTLITTTESATFSTTANSINIQACVELFEHIYEFSLNIILYTETNNKNIDIKSEENSSTNFSINYNNQINLNNNIKIEETGGITKVAKMENNNKFYNNNEELEDIDEKFFEESDAFSIASTSSTTSSYSSFCARKINNNNNYCNSDKRNLKRRFVANNAMPTTTTNSIVSASSQREAAIKRYAMLMQLLPSLRWFNQNVLVELFFSGLIGNLSIETVMPFIMSMDIVQIFKESQTASNSIKNCATSPQFFKSNNIVNSPTKKTINGVQQQH